MRTPLPGMFIFRILSIPVGQPALRFAKQSAKVCSADKKKSENEGGNKKIEPLQPP